MVIGENSSIKKSSTSATFDTNPPVEKHILSVFASTEDKYIYIYFYPSDLLQFCRQEWYSCANEFISFHPSFEGQEVFEYSCQLNECQMFDFTEYYDGRKQKLGALLTHGQSAALYTRYFFPLASSV